MFLICLFQLTFSPFHRMIVDQIRQFRSPHFDYDIRAWLIAFGDHDDLLQNLRKMTKLQVEIEPLPIYLRKVCLPLLLICV